MFIWQENYTEVPSQCTKQLLSNLPSSLLLILLLHPSLSSPLPLLITSASTIIGSPSTPLHCCVPTLSVDLGNSIVFVYRTNNTSWIDYYYQDDVNTTDAHIMSIQVVLVGFVLHMVGSMYVAMLLAQTLLKLEDSASNMAT
jgi:hypothetical protein